jgi:two-component system, response regulator RegA
MIPAGSEFLVVDDDDALRGRLVRALNDRGFVARGAADAGQALTSFQEAPPDYVILDLRMPGPSGLEVLREMRALDAELPVVILSAYGSIPTAVDAVRLGALDLVLKPADLDTILAAFVRHEGEVQTRPLETPSLARSEWEQIQRVLAETGNNISEAARRLGLHRRTLQRKLAKYPPRW